MKKVKQLTCQLFYTMSAWSSFLRNVKFFFLQQVISGYGVNTTVKDAWLWEGRKTQVVLVRSDIICMHRREM